MASDGFDDDEVERASEREAKLLKEKLRQIKSKPRQADLVPYATWDGEHCFECGDDLPMLRIKDGRVFCTTCQAARETRK